MSALNVLRMSEEAKQGGDTWMDMPEEKTAYTSFNVTRRSFSSYILSELIDNVCRCAGKEDSRVVVFQSDKTIFHRCCFL